MSVRHYSSLDDFALKQDGKCSKGTYYKNDISIFSKKTEQKFLQAHIIRIMT